MKYYNDSFDIPVTTGSVTTPIIDASQLIKLSVVVVGGAGTTLTGSVQMQVSNDEIDTSYAMLPAPTNFVNSGSPVAITTAATNYLLPQQDICYRSIRFVFTGAGGNNAPVSIKVMAIAI